MVIKESMTPSSRRFQIADVLALAAGAATGIAVALTISLWMRLPAPGASGLGEILRTLTGTVRSQASVMALPAVGDTQAYWYMARAGGIVAYVLLFMATFWGIAMSGKMTKGALRPSLIYGLHQFFPILALVFAVFHAAALLGDHYIGFRPSELLIPFTASYEPIWTGLGTIAAYLLAALIASFYVRKWIGRRTWRAFHYVSYAAFLMALAHGISAGSDSGLPIMRQMYLLTGALIVFATSYRILAHPRAT